jgi:hypothetical protein
MKEDDVNLIWVSEAKALDNYCLLLTFNNGSRKIFDCRPLVEQQPIFAALRDKAVFNNIILDGWTVTWANGSIDIAPEFLYEHSVPAYSTGEEISHQVAEDKMSYNE